MRSLIAILVMLTAFACCPCRHLATGTTDSVRIEVRERIVEVRDTVMVHLPDERVDTNTADTMSRIETSAAISTAVVSDGRLLHSLWNKRQPIGVAVDFSVTVEDITKERITTIREVVEVERKLTWWERFRLDGFWVLLALSILFVRKRVTKLFG